MKRLWHRLWRWLTLADVPVMRKLKLKCDKCDEEALVFISWRSFGGDPVEQQLCRKHHNPPWFSNRV